jgi:hypothetical protein
MAEMVLAEVAVLAVAEIVLAGVVQMLAVVTASRSLPPRLSFLLRSSDGPYQIFLGQGLMVLQSLCREIGSPSPTAPSTLLFIPTSSMTSHPSASLFTCGIVIISVTV